MPINPSVKGMLPSCRIQPQGIVKLLSKPPFRGYSSLQPLQSGTRSHGPLICRSFKSGGNVRPPKRHDFFSSNSRLKSSPRESETDQQLQEGQRRKSGRSAGAKTSLRRVAVEAQRSKDAKGVRKGPDTQKTTKVGCAPRFFSENSPLTPIRPSQRSVLQKSMISVACPTSSKPQGTN